MLRMFKGRSGIGTVRIPGTPFAVFLTRCEKSQRHISEDEMNSLFPYQKHHQPQGPRVIQETSSGVPRSMSFAVMDPTALGTSGIGRTCREPIHQCQEVHGSRKQIRFMVTGLME